MVCEAVFMVSKLCDIISNFVSDKKCTYEIISHFLVLMFCYVRGSLFYGCRYRFHPWSELG